MSSRLINRNIVAPTGRSSMRFEPEIWDVLSDMCIRENVTISDLVRRVDESRTGRGRTSAIRVLAINYLKEAVTEEGHRLAGHGTRDYRFGDPS